MPWASLADLPKTFHCFKVVQNLKSGKKTKEKEFRCSNMQLTYLTWKTLTFALRVHIKNIIMCETIFYLMRI